MRIKVAIIVIVFCFIAGISFADSAVIARKIIPAPGIMTTEFKAAKKVIIHPSGVVTEYSSEQLANHKAELVKQRDRINEMIAGVDSDIQSCAAALVEP